MKIYKLLLISFTILVFASSCEDYLDINVDPNAATAADPDLLIPAILSGISATRVIEANPGQSFYVQNWISNGSAGVFLNPERYTISPFTTGNTWNAAYLNGNSNLQLAIDDALSSDPQKANIAAQGEILKAFNYYNLTTLFEDIPYTQALKPIEFPQPEFDSQETVLRGILTDIDRAVALIDPASELTGATDGDLLYKGNMELWRKFAKSLKFKALILLYQKDASVASQIEQLINEGDLILTVGDEAEFKYFNLVTNANNRWKLYNQFGGINAAGLITSASSFIFAGAPLVDIMNDLNDPRLPVYFTEGADAAPGQFVGGEPGVAGQSDLIAFVSRNQIRMDYPDRFVSSGEINLLIAEFYAKNGDFELADDYFRAGVGASMAYFNGKPGAIPAADQAAYLASLPELSSLSAAGAVEVVQIQQYIDLNERGAEAWTNWRRTKVPALELPEQATLSSIIRRWPYPPSEVNTNPKTPTSKPLDTPMWFEN